MSRWAAIPEPTQDAYSLQMAIQSLKENVELLTGQRGPLEEYSIDERIFQLTRTVDGNTATITETYRVLVNQDEAIAQRTTTLEAEVGAARGGTANLSARIQQVDEARASGDSALAIRATALEAEVTLARTGESNLKARIDNILQASVDGDTALALDISTLDAAYKSADTTLQANITTVNQARVDGDTALALDISTLDAAYKSADTTLQANITTVNQARVDGDSALASQITSLTTTVDGNTASISTQQTSIDGVSVKFGVTGTINGSTGGFQFTGIQKLDGSVSYGVEINGSLVVNGSLGSTKIADGAITTAKIAAGTITADRITVGTITADRIVNLGIDTARIASNAVSNSGAIDTASSAADKVMNFFARTGDVITIHAVIFAGSLNSGWTWALRLDGSNIYASPPLFTHGDTIDRWFAVTAGFTGTHELRATLVTLGENISLRAYALAVSK